MPKDEKAGLYQGVSVFSCKRFFLSSQAAYDCVRFVVSVNSFTFAPWNGYYKLGEAETTYQGVEMKKAFFLAAVMIFGAILVPAANKPQTGTIISENSVACGSKLEKNKRSVELLCQEYVVRTATTDYHIRQQKPSDKALIPINTSIEFTLDKDKIKFKANSKSYEYVVVSEVASTKP